MPPFFTARGCSPNSAIARAADNLGYHRGSCGCSRSNRTVYSPRISIPTRRRRILDRRCHRGRRHTTRHNRTHGGNRNLGGVVRCLRGIHGACSCFLSFGDELHLARLWRRGDVGFLEIARATRSGRRVAHVWRLNRHDLCRHATIVPDETRGKAQLGVAPTFRPVRVSAVEPDCHAGLERGRIALRIKSQSSP